MFPIGSIFGIPSPPAMAGICFEPVIRLLAALLALIAGAAHAQPRIAVVLATAPAAASVRLEALQEGLRQLGHVPGRTVVIDARSWLGDKRTLAELAAVVVGERPAVIVAE